MPNEAAKIRDRIWSLLDGKTVLDLGCGDEKICPWAVGVDDGSEWGRQPAGPDVVTDVAPGNGSLVRALAERGHHGKFDVVFSSHVAEHLDAPIEDTLRHWMTFVKPGGLLILYLPEEGPIMGRYRYDPKDPGATNPAHRHSLSRTDFAEYVKAVPSAELVRLAPDIGPDRYSFLAVLKRKPFEG